MKWNSICLLCVGLSTLPIYFKSSLDSLLYLTQCKLYVNSCYAALFREWWKGKKILCNSFWIFPIFSWLNPQVWNLQLQRALSIHQYRRKSTPQGLCIHYFPVPVIDRKQTGWERVYFDLQFQRRESITAGKAQQWDWEASLTLIIQREKMEPSCKISKFNP